MYLGRSLRRLIDDKYLELEKLKGLPLQRSRHFQKRIALAAEKHSHMMEVDPFSKKPKKRKSGRIKRKKTKEIVAASIFLKDSLHIGFSEHAIKKTNYLIVPEFYNNHGTAYYRNVNARNLTNDPILPPRWEKVPDMMSGLVQKLNNFHSREDFHPVEVAAYAHLAIAYIHPFFDGNGRTARLVQDSFLDTYDIPVPIIRSNEKSDYQAILKRGMRSYRGEDDGFGIENFVDFIAIKVYESLRHVLSKK